MTEKKTTLRITLDVTDAVRHYIGDQLAPLHKTKKGLALRRPAASFLQDYVQARLDQLDQQWHILPAPPLSQIEAREHAQAIHYLRAAGKSDEQIGSWILAQKARIDFPSILKAVPHV